METKQNRILTGSIPRQLLLFFLPIWFGTAVVAAWRVYGKIDFLFWMTLFAMGTLVTTFAGQNFGARQYDRVRRGNWWRLGLTAAMTVAIILTFYPSAGEGRRPI